MGLLGTAHGWGDGGCKMKFGTVISYLKKIQKIYKSRDTLLEFCWHQYFFTGNQQVLLYQEIEI